MLKPGAGKRPSVRPRSVRADAVPKSAACATGGPEPGLAGIVVPAPCCPIVELRQYTLHPGRLDGFVRLFECEFIEPQEAAGMRVIGHFRDLDDPDRFVWLRGFADMPSRARSLEAFYGGPVWKAQRDAANANFIDTDNVLLLHPLHAQAGFVLDNLQRASPGAEPGNGFVVVTVYQLKSAAAPAFGEFFRTRVQPALAQAGIVVAAQFETEIAANTFPRLPVRTGESVFMWVAHFGDRSRGEAAKAQLAHSAHWRESIRPELAQQLASPTQVLRLVPAARSLWPGDVGR